MPGCLWYFIELVFFYSILKYSLKYNNHLVGSWYLKWHKHPVGSILKVEQLEQPPGSGVLSYNIDSSGTITKLVPVLHSALPDYKNHQLVMYMECSSLAPCPRTIHTIFVLNFMSNMYC
jgi:hypothetical protein